ncbi:uncharacterized protein DC041_0002986 [Schistosoma bovis]|uniref:Uncharacterized protein n=1 Tax=Schistosoma bovis TaxID=6184 RepID=A0A430QPU8_SCHBO|nr:uncharacterized protein DC041_0002986 [Schistosoma bovis]
MVFKRSVFESRKRPQGYLRPKVRVEFATLLQHSWPRTITERYLNQLIPNSSAQILAILEALSLKPGERRSLITPKPPVDSSDWEMSDVYTELFIASMELIYPNSSKKLIPNFLSGIHVIRKIPVDREKTSTGLINHTIALNETKFLKWTQLDLIHYQYNYHDSAEEYDENGELSSESKAIPSSTINTNVSCTIDSLMKLIQIYFACAQYDIFDLVSRDTLHVFEEKLSDLIKEQAPKEFIQYIQAQIDTLELLRALHSAQLSIKLLNKNEIIEDLLQQPIVQETPAANLSKSSMKQQDTSNSISMYDTAILIDIIIVLWDYCHILCHKWFIQNKLKIEYFNTIQMKLIGILYLFSLMKTLLESLNIDVADGLMSCNLIFYVIWITEMFEQKLFHHNSRKESSATECNENDKLAICLIDLWTGIWNKVMDIIYWSCNMISKRMIFLQINHPKNLEINSLSELQVELLWFEHTIRWKLRNLEWLTWCDLNEMSKEKVHKKIEQMDENSLKQCGRNKMSKVFYYCLKAETEVNNETAKKYYKIAEKLLFNKWSNEFHSIGSKEVIDCQQSTGLSKPHENTLATERFRSDRPPPPIVIAKCENSMVFQTQKWNPLSGEQVICNNSSSVLKVTDLTPNEEYAFAVAAYNKEGHPIGSHKHGLGHSTKPVLAYSSLCIYTGLCHLLQSAFRRNLSQCLMAQSVNIIWEYLTEKYDTTDDDNSTHLTGLKLKELNSFQCSSILLKHLTTCIFWHCSFIQKSENLRSCKFDNSTYLLDKQIQKIHLSEKLIIGLELSAMLNDVQLLLDFANLIYETLSFNIEMSSVTHDYAKILLKSLTIILGVRKCTTKLILLDETLNRKLTQIMIKFTFELIKVFEVLNELKDIKPSINVSTKKRISQGKLNSSYLTGRRKSRQNTDQMGELNSVIKTIDAYSYLVAAKLNPPRGELFGYEDEYQAIACMATKSIKAAIKDVIKFNRRTIFLQLVNVILERVHVSQINLIQPCLNEIRTWLNHRDQLLVKSCQSYETTDIMKLNDNMNATSLDKTKSAGYSQEMNHLFSLLTDYYSHKMKRMKLRNVCQDEWTQRSQEHLYDTNSYEKNDKNQCPVMENEHEINEDFIDTQFVIKLPDNIEKIFDFIKRSTNLGYRAKCWPKVYNAAKFCWNATSLLSSLLCKLSIWCNEAKIRRETDVKLEANIKITNKNSRKGINTDGEKNSIQTQARNSSVSEIMNYLKQCTNRRALANIAWSCWFMSADNILDLFESSLNHDETTETKSRYDVVSSIHVSVKNDWLNEQSGKIWRSEIMNNQFDIDWNWLHCFILKALEIICRASKWEYLTYLGLKAVGTLGKHWAPGILPFIIFGQNQIMERLKKQKTTNTTINDMNNIEQLNEDFSKLVNRSQIQLYSALYHYNFIQFAYTNYNNMHFLKFMNQVNS